MFAAGVYGFITRKNMIAMLISLELMLNAVDINFVVFNRFLFPGQLDGLNTTKLLSTALSISSSEISIAIMFLRVMNP